MSVPNFLMGVVRKGLARQERAGATSATPPAQPSYARLPSAATRLFAVGYLRKGRRMKPANYTHRHKLSVSRQVVRLTRQQCVEATARWQVRLQPCGSKVVGNIWQADCQLCRCFFTTADVDCTFRLLACPSLPK